MFYLWMTKVLQDGGYVMKDGRFDLSHPALESAYEFLDRLQNSRGARQDNRRFKDTAGDLAYRYGLQIAPSYYLNPLMKQHNYRVVPWVTSGERVILDERRHYLCVARSTPEKERASWEFLKWVTSKDAPHPDGAWTFHLSARKDLLDRNEVRHKISSWAPGFEVLHETKGWNVHHGDQVPGRFDAMNRLEEIVTSLFHGNLTFSEAMEKAESDCNEILEDYRKAEEEESGISMVPTEKADSFWRDGDFERASIEYLKILSEFPKSIREAGIRFKTLASLRNSGCFIEAETLATSTRPDGVASLLLWERETRGTSREVSNSSEVDQAIHLARIASASAFRGEASLDSISRFFEICRTVTTASDSWREGLPLLAAFHRGMIDQALRLHSHGEGIRSLIGDFELESKPSHDLARRLTEETIGIASLVAEKEPERSFLLFDALDTRIEIGRRMGDLEGIAASYRRVLAQFPEAVEAPERHLQFAIFLAEEVGDLQAALEIGVELQTRYPQNPLVDEIRVRQAIWLYEARRYQEAKKVLETIRADGKGDNAGQAEVLSGLCDYALGNAAEGEHAVREFIDAHPEHHLAKRARGWLMTNRIAEFQFLQATHIIQDISGAESSLFDPGLIEKELLENSF